MDALTVLQREKTAILSEISQAAREGKVDLVLSASQKLEKIELLISRHSQIIQELEELRGNKAIFGNKVPIEKQGAPVRGHKLNSGVVTAREHGRKIREAFLQRLTADGIHLQLVNGKTIYLTKSGKRVGIAVATERQPNRWFLGLPTASFDHAVLLCQREKGDIVEIRLPEKFFSEYGGAMSQSKGQVKFNIVQRGGGFLVQVPGTVGVNANAYSSNYSFLL